MEATRSQDRFSVAKVRQAPSAASCSRTARPRTCPVVVAVLVSSGVAPSTASASAFSTEPNVADPTVSLALAEAAMLGR